MRRQPRFTIGGWLAAVAGVAVGLALIAWVARLASPASEGPIITGSIFAVPLVLWVDTCFVIKGAQSGRLPDQPGWSESAFNRRLIALAICLWGPFGWAYAQHLSALIMLPFASALVGATLLVPLHWLVPQRIFGELAWVALASTLFIMGLIRLAARGRTLWAWALVLPVACYSSLILRAYLSD